MSVKKYIVLILIFASFGALAYLTFKSQNAQKPLVITNFEECVAAGNPVMESFPEQCRTVDGKTFTNTKNTVGQEITVTGEVVCLPHKDREGPQTLECAFGIMDQNGQYYALNDPSFKFLSDLPTGKIASVTGTFKSQPESIYDIVGVIEIVSIKS